MLNMICYRLKIANDIYKDIINRTNSFDYFDDYYY